MIRPGRVLAIARSDLAVEFAGRQGLLLPAVIAGLLLPASTVPSPVRQWTASLRDEAIVVRGDVPDEIRDADYVVDRSRYVVEFTAEPEALVVDALIIPKGLRRDLDAMAAREGKGPNVQLEAAPRGFYFPGRTALLSLIAASALTGAVSQSIGGERQRKTLVVLLAAAVTRTEIVLGKWLAWGGLGAGSALVGAAVAIGLGHAHAGAWLVPMVTVPLATVALGLWLVRRAGDVMAGSATALRVLPATLSIAAVVAWLLGDQDPWLGALVPLGGALLTAGQTWPVTGPSFLSAATTMLFTAGALWATIRDLEETPDRDPPEQRTLVAALVGALAAVVWWLPVAGPELWAAAGNAKITALLPRDNGVLSGAIGLLLFSFVRAVRGQHPIQDELGLKWPGLSAGLWALAALAALCAASLLGQALEGTALGGLGSGEVRERFAQALHPGFAGLGVALLAVCADELLFRGWLQRVVGPWRSALVWTLVKSPLDPVGGLLSGLACSGVVAASGSVWPSLLARIAFLLFWTFRWSEP